MAKTAKNSIILTAILSSVLTASMLYWKTLKEEGKVCTTKECINQASQILNSMDTSADPCNNFYQFVCGGWIKQNPIPPEKQKISNFDILNDQNTLLLRDLLETNYTSDRDAVKKAKIYYRSCMDEETADALGGRPALNLMKNFGGFPLLGDAFNESTFDLEEFLARVKYTVYRAPIISIGVSLDEKNSSAMLLQMDQPNLLLPDRRFYLLEELRNQTFPLYAQYMKRYLTLLWEERDKMNNESTVDEGKMDDFIKKVLQFERELAAIMLSPEQKLDVVATYNKMTIGDLSMNVTGSFDWLRYINLMMSKVNRTVTSEEEILVYDIIYFQQFMDVVEKYSSSFIQNYYIWTGLDHLVILLPKNYRDTKADIREALSGVTKEQERWKICVENTKYLLSGPVDSMFVKKVFSRKSKQLMLEMIDYLMKAFANELPALTWMDEATRNASLEKLGMLNSLIGYPDYIVEEDNPKLDEEFELIQIVEDDYFTNSFELIRDASLAALEELGETLDREEWAIGAATVNAYYTPNLNHIAFPAAILQSPYFAPSRPYAMNYGAIGTIIGHEITHGFDTIGSHFNGVGNLMNWWTDFSRNHFEEKAECFREQYSELFYEHAGAKLNGNLTIGENIADNGGLRQSFEAYKLWKKDNEHLEFSLPGLEEYSDEQLVFIGSATNWCASETVQSAARAVTENRHSPSEFRSDVPVHNFEKFGEVFNCKRGVDKLYPNTEDTCRVW